MSETKQITAAEFTRAFGPPDDLQQKSRCIHHDKEGYQYLCPECLWVYSVVRADREALLDELAKEADEWERRTADTEDTLTKSGAMSETLLESAKAISRQTRHLVRLLRAFIAARRGK